MRKADRTDTKQNKRNWAKGVAAALMAAIVLSTANPMPAMAAGKMTVDVKTPKKNVKATAKKIVIHTKSPVQLKVKYAGKDVTRKATYKANGKAIRVKNGKITAKKNGTAALTVKYKGMAKKFNIVMSNHNWKAHKKTKTVTKTIARCNCGANLTDLVEKKYCKECQETCIGAKENGLCYCKEIEHSMNHILNGEPDNWWSETIEEKVSYVDCYTCACGAKKAAKK